MTFTKRLSCFLTVWLGMIALAGSGWSQQDAVTSDKFVIVVYNVENLFDADGVALYDDYKPETYQPKDLLTKLTNITKILANFNNGKGPEIVLFEEFEADQTPSSSPVNYQEFLKKYSDMTVEQMLNGNVSAAVRDLPVQALLLKSLKDAGLAPYNVSVGEYRADPTGRTVAHVNATFSQFPIAKSITHQTDGARGILEVVHTVGSFQVITFNNHWKSGASNLDDEKTRLGNAKTLRDRVDQVLGENPSADIVIGGDFNSQYNQSKSNPKMTKTAVNDVAGSQGDELAIRKPNGPKLYNLWHDVPKNRRGSDVYNEKWGTLMQIMITPGLYDFHGIQYVDNSFTAAALENVNAQAGSRVPISWEYIDGVGAGFSDHLPVYAQFQVVKDNDKSRFVELTNPGVNDDPSDLNAVDYSFATKAKHRSVKSLGSDKAIKSMENFGHVFLVEATVSADFPFRIKIFDEEFTVWAYNEKFRVNMYKQFPVGKPMVFLGELGVHKGKWQFIVRDPSWLEVKN